jgi:hypothetical protein
MIFSYYSNTNNKINWTNQKQKLKILGMKNVNLIVCWFQDFIYKQYTKQRTPQK